MKKSFAMIMIWAMVISTLPMNCFADTLDGISEDITDSDSEYVEAAADSVVFEGKKYILSKAVVSNTEAGVTWYIFDDGFMYLTGVQTDSICWHNHDYKTAHGSTIKKIYCDFNPVGVPENSECGYGFMDLFEGLEEVTFISFGPNCNTSRTRYMDGMFFGCKKLKTVDMTSIDTSNVIDFKKMFAQCYELEAVDLSGFKTDNVKDMTKMFEDCEALVSVKFGNYNCKNVESMEAMFRYCEKLEYADLGNIVTSGKLENVYDMFAYCKSLLYLDMSSMNVENTEGYMFEACKKLDTLKTPAVVRQYMKLPYTMYDYNRDYAESPYMWNPNTIYVKTKGQQPLTMPSATPSATPKPGATPTVAPIDESTVSLGKAEDGKTIIEINKVFAVGQKVDLKAYVDRFLTIPEGKLKFISSDKKVVAVNNAGLAKLKSKEHMKSALVTVSDRKTKEVYGYISLTVVLPQVEKKKEASVGDTLKLEDYFTNGEGLCPANFQTSKDTVASVAEDGTIKILAKGNAKIKYQIGEGKYASKYTLKIKVK